MSGASNLIERVAENDYYWVDCEDQHLRILLLEDLRTDAELIKLQLRKLPFDKTVEHVTNRSDFESAYQEFRPHIVLSDYSLPQFTGMQALEYVRERNKYLPFIICTGSMNEETAVACIKAGADDYVLKDALGRLSSAIENALTAKTNLIEKERAFTDLEQSEANFRALAENAPDNIYKIDQYGKILYVSGQVDGVPREQAIGTLIFDYIDKRNEAPLREAIQKTFEDHAITTIEMEGNPNDPESQWYYCRIAPVVSEGHADSAVFIPSNITPRVRAQRELEEHRQRLYHLTQYLENVRDEEKEKIAMAIHDQLGQELTGNKLGLFWIKQQLSINNTEQIDLDAIMSKVDYLIDLTTTTIQTVRRIAHELRPVVLDNMGLIAALEWHIGNYNDHHLTVCNLHIDVDEFVFEKEFSTAIYRITQEALTNIDKHAEASTANVTLINDDKHLILEIEDDGKGLHVSDALQSKSLGLFGMRERIKRWDGEFSLESSPGEGTRITIKFSLDTLTSDGAIS